MPIHNIHLRFIYFLLVGLLSSQLLISGVIAATNGTFDDTSLDFKFSGAWLAANQSSPCSPVCPDCCPAQLVIGNLHNNSWHGASRTGKFSGSFTFRGTDVYLFGVDRSPIDAPIVFTLGSVQSTHNSTANETTLYDVLFFAGLGLDATKTHTLSWTVDITNASLGHSSAVVSGLLDYALVTVGDNSSIPVAGSTLNSKSSPTSLSRPLSSDAISASPHSKTPVAAIVGSAVGGVLAAALLLGLLFLVWRRKVHRQSAPGNLETEEHNVAFTISPERRLRGAKARDLPRVIPNADSMASSETGVFSAVSANAASVAEKSGPRLGPPTTRERLLERRSARMCYGSY
ncbi:hypothetical protein C8R44DRAFT_889860 [Mycena epipterygia]|nr:hypothetical protein C8R44DRAFT_889860 [Mycena epipterygia]